MPIFEPDKDELNGLDEGQLEELVARLCEAELASRHGNLRDVMWSGSLTAADGGVDVRVTISNDHFEGDFVPRLDNVFQVKAKSMPRGEILKEMTVDGDPTEVLRQLCDTGGAYIIASTEDCSPPTYRRRIGAMREAVTSLGSSGTSIHLDFYDRSRLHRWVRQYPTVQVWSRSVLGRPIIGWRPFGRWSTTPAGEDDSLISDEGIRVIVPSVGNRPMSLEETIPHVRKLISSSEKAIRVTGLSGVGKTRFVQALFEDEMRVSDLPCMIDLVHASAKGSTNDNFQRSVGRTFTGL